MRNNSWRDWGACKLTEYDGIDGNELVILLFPFELFVVVVDDAYIVVVDVFMLELSRLDDEFNVLDRIEFIINWLVDVVLLLEGFVLVGVPFGFWSFRL